jgi:general secretion pathway protein C
MVAGSQVMSVVTVSETSGQSGLIRFTGFLARYGLLIFLSWQTAEVAWWILGHQTGFRDLRYTPAARPVTSNESGSVLSAIGLFGDANKQIASEKPVSGGIDAPETRLQLELKGVVTASQKEGSGAIIAERGQEGVYYRVGDSLPGTVELAEVYVDRVILRRSGKIETLRFAESTRGAGADSGRASVERGISSTIKTADDFLGEAERRLTQDPQGTLGSVGLSPVTSGESSGYVYNGQNPMLRQMNLQKGDVIRSVNGFPIGDVQKDRELLRQFYEEGSVMVEIERDGTFFSINYPLR